MLDLLGSKRSLLVSLIVLFCVFAPVAHGQGNERLIKVVYVDPMFLSEQEPILKNTKESNYLTNKFSANLKKALEEKYDVIVSQSLTNREPLYQRLLKSKKLKSDINMHISIQCSDSNSLALFLNEEQFNINADISGNTLSEKIISGLNRFYFEKSEELVLLFKINLENFGVGNITLNDVVIENIAYDIKYILNDLKAPTVVVVALVDLKSKGHANDAYLFLKKLETGLVKTVTEFEERIEDERYINR